MQINLVMTGSKYISLEETCMFCCFTMQTNYQTRYINIHLDREHVFVWTSGSYSA